MSNRLIKIDDKFMDGFRQYLIETTGIDPDTDKPIHDKKKGENDNATD